MEEMNPIEMQAQESAAGTAGYAESTAPAGPEAPQGDLGGADNEGTGARRQTPEENARFAAMRNPETGMPFASKAEFVAWRDGAAGRGRAQAAPVEPETLARLEAQLRQQFRATDPEFLAQAAELKKAHDREAQFSNDLKTIRAAYPDEKAQKVEELGIEFLKLCAGGISPLVAYEAIRNEKRDLPQALAAQGLTGGMSESALAGMYNSYGNNRNTIDRGRNESLAALLDTLNSNRSSALQSYNSQLSAAEQQKMAYQMQLEQALANGSAEILQNKYDTLQNLDNAYAQQILALQQAAAQAAQKRW